MNILVFLPAMLEVFLVFVTLGTFFPRNFLMPRPKLWYSVLLFLAVLSMLISILLGGSAVAAMAVKVLSFALAIAFAMRKPRAARIWLVVSIVISLLAQASIGNVFNKLSTVPFLLMACLWATSRERLEGRALLVILLALGAECFQAFALDSRGLLLSVVMASVLLFIPLKFVRRTVTASAMLLPIIYPLALTLVLAALLSGSDLLQATSSNFERSAMAAWSVQNMPAYPLVGPGSSLFADEINTIKVLGEQAVGDLYDPHQFLLSAWLWLGSVTVALLYFSWCALWFFEASDRKGFSNGRVRLFSILAILAILTFVLSPPDTTARVQVAMLTGVAIAGLRDPFIFTQKRKTLVTQIDRQ